MRSATVHLDPRPSVFYRANIELPFFNYYLKDKGALKLPEAYVFETGSNRWKTYETVAAGERAHSEPILSQRTASCRSLLQHGVKFLR